MKTMKHLLYIIVTLFICIACDKDDTDKVFSIDDYEKYIVGEWQLISKIHYEQRSTGLNDDIKDLVGPEEETTRKEIYVFKENGESIWYLNYDKNDDGWSQIEKESWIVKNGILRIGDHSPYKIILLTPTTLRLEMHFMDAPTIEVYEAWTYKRLR